MLNKNWEKTEIQDFLDSKRQLGSRENPVCRVFCIERNALMVCDDRRDVKMYRKPIALETSICSKTLQQNKVAHHSILKRPR
uniref:Uncharacterized protein n=1 Tax=Anguilla anguilla TaxID=7936 RepID=A0A0E9QI67_ANGAN